MGNPVTAIYDANILYSAPLHDLFIRLAQSGIVRARWTETIHDEWIRNVVQQNPQLTPERLARTRGLMNEGGVTEARLFSRSSPSHDWLIANHLRHTKQISFVRGRLILQS